MTDDKKYYGFLKGHESDEIPGTSCWHFGVYFKVQDDKKLVCEVSKEVYDMLLEPGRIEPVPENYAVRYWSVDPVPGLIPLEDKRQKPRESVKKESGENLPKAGIIHLPEDLFDRSRAEIIIWAKDNLDMEINETRKADVVAKIKSLVEGEKNE